MTTTQLSILRTIAAYQPILKDNLYRLLSIRLTKDGHYYQLKNLRKQGYIEYERKRGPVWLTIRGKELIENEHLTPSKSH